MDTADSGRKAWNTGATAEGYQGYRGVPMSLGLDVSHLQRALRMRAGVQADENKGS